MLYKTHKCGATLGMLIAFQVMQSKGLLLANVNPFIQLAVMYPASDFGATFSDLDHGWSNVKEKTPLNYVVHKLLHIRRCTHRSWQTHSIAVTGALCFLLYGLVNMGSMVGLGLNTVDWVIIRLLVTGFVVGVWSHLILDAFSTAGIHIWPGFKLRFVPKSTKFKTGGAWENLVFKALVGGILVSIINIFCSLFGTSILGIIQTILKG